MKTKISDFEGFAICDPRRCIVHTTVSLTAEGAIEQWIETERGCNIIVNAGRGMRGETPRCAPSWEQFEAEGYSVQPVIVKVSYANHV